jgi:hypothetical protein
VKILNDQCRMLEKFIIFQCSVYKLEDFIFQANGIAGFLFFLIILSEPTDQCVIGI